ncbi:MAG: HD domain-containing protein [Ferrimicrobium sp.]
MKGVSHLPGYRLAHSGDSTPTVSGRPRIRQDREHLEDATLSLGATRAFGAGNRAQPEEPDYFRTCFERDRDRIIHSDAFRRLAGKTQVFVFPRDHQRTRLTHALEVSQVAVSISRSLGLNVDLTEAIALGHDCGHGPGGHASETAFSTYLPGGFDHAPWGANIALSNLNLCAETLDGIRNHSWSRPSPSTPEGAVVSWADRCAYCAHDLEDAIREEIVDLDDLPSSVTTVLGTSRGEQLNQLIVSIITATESTGVVSMEESTASALADLREFNYTHIYTRDESLQQAERVVSVLHALVDFLLEHPSELPDTVIHTSEITTDVIAYVAGMTDRFAFATAERLLGWPPERIPRGVDLKGSRD